MAFEHQYWDDFGQRTVLAEERQEQFGIYDSKGREIGARLMTWEADGRFALVVHATRNDLTFGATQPRRWFDSADDRAKAIERYLSDARRRAMNR